MGSRSKARQNLCKGEDYVPDELEETDSSNYDSDGLIHGGVRGCKLDVTFVTVVTDGDDNVRNGTQRNSIDGFNVYEFTGVHL